MEALQQTAPMSGAIPKYISNKTDLFVYLFGSTVCLLDTVPLRRCKCNAHFMHLLFIFTFSQQSNGEVSCRYDAAISHMSETLTNVFLFDSFVVLLRVGTPPAFLDKAYLYLYLIYISYLAYLYLFFSLIVLTYFFSFCAHTNWLEGGSK